jgi:hypothetical protein
MARQTGTAAGDDRLEEPICVSEIEALARTGWAGELRRKCRAHLIHHFQCAADESCLYQ